jgi:hypothetical protein
VYLPENVSVTLQEIIDWNWHIDLYENIFFKTHMIHSGEFDAESLKQYISLQTEGSEKDPEVKLVV